MELPAAQTIINLNVVTVPLGHFIHKHSCTASVVFSRATEFKGTLAICFKIPRTMSHFDFSAVYVRL